MKEILRLGRQADNDIIFEDKQVSRYHCTLRKVPEGILITDLESSHGTFVNEKRIARTLCKSTDTVSLGKLVKIEIALFAPLFEQNKAKFPLSYQQLLTKQAERSEQERIQTEFLKLETVYEEHMKQKKALLRKDLVRKTGLRAGLALIPMVGMALGQLSNSVGENVREKVMDLDEDFKKKYVCPSCFRYLGAEPFANLKRRGKCQFCKTKWV